MVNVPARYCGAIGDGVLPLREMRRQQGAGVAEGKVTLCMYFEVWLHVHGRQILSLSNNVTASVDTAPKCY